MWAFVSLCSRGIVGVCRYLYRAIFKFCNLFFTSVLCVRMCLDVNCVVSVMFVRVCMCVSCVRVGVVGAAGVPRPL